MDIISEELSERIEQIYKALPHENAKKRFLQDLQTELNFFTDRYLNRDGNVEYCPIKIKPSPYEIKVAQNEGKITPLEPTLGTFIGETRKMGADYGVCINENGALISVPMKNIMFLPNNDINIAL